MTAERDSSRDNEDVERLAADIASRVQFVCRDWPAADLDALVHEIARLKLRWAEADQTRPIRSNGGR